jgi:hypothetical protein
MASRKSLEKKGERRRRKEDVSENSTNRPAPSEDSPSPRDATHDPEPLPSYEYNPPSPSSHLTPTSTTPSLHPSRIPTQSSTSASLFPTSTPPAYSPSSLRILFAVPTTSPTPSSPLLPCTSPSLPNYGIPPTTFLTFLTTLSSHLTARTPTRLLNHVGDVPKQLGKDLVSTTASAGRQLTSSAKHFNPIGVLGSVVGLTFGVTGTLVGGVMGALPRTLSTKPRSGVQRAGEGLGEANAKWLHERGLHAELVDMNELARRVGMSVGEMLEVAGRGSAQGQMGRLDVWVGEVIVGGDDEKGAIKLRKARGTSMGSEEGRDRKDQRSFARGAESVGLRVGGELSVEGEDEGSEGDAGAGLELELGPETLWLVVSRWEGMAA